MHTIHKLILAALAAYCIASCSLTADQKKTLRADGKAVVRTVEGTAIRLGEAELQKLIDDSQK